MNTTKFSLSSNRILIFYHLHLPKLQLIQIGERCLNQVKEDLVIENYPNLEKIIVKKNSLENLNSLKICDNEKLKTMKIEDGAIYNVKNVIIESI